MSKLPTNMQLRDPSWRPTKLVQLITQFNSINSPLLRLPAELRLKIWGYILGGNDILIASTDPVDSPKPLINISLLNAKSSPTFVSSTRISSRNLLSLPLVCRQTNTETTPLMAFELSAFHLQGVYAFYAFADSLSPIQRGAVREIVLGIVMLQIQLNQMQGGSRMRDNFPGLLRIVVMRGVFRQMLKLGWGRLNAD
jgi:hypothetical protein